MTVVDRLNGVSGDLAFKTPCACATTANVTLSGLQTLDGIVQTEGMRTLVKNQSDTTQNGIYGASSSAWTRAVDFDGANDVVTGTAVFVSGGSTYAGNFFYVSTAGDPVPGTAMVFTQFPGVAGPTGPTGATGPQGATGAAGSSFPIATAGGSADALTATYSPPLTLADGTLCALIATAANATATPTFAPNGLTAHTIVKYAGSALVAGDIAGDDHVIILEYDATGTRWVLLNPAVTLTTLGAAKVAGGNAFTGQQTGGVSALTSSSNSIAMDMSLNNNFSHTFTENTTLANPTNIVAGQSGQITFTQHASSAKTLAFASSWKEISGTIPVVSTTTSAQNLLSWYAADSTHIWFSLNKNGVS